MRIVLWPYFGLFRAHVGDGIALSAGFRCYVIFASPVLVMAV